MSDRWLLKAASVMQAFWLFVFAVSVPEMSETMPIWAIGALGVLLAAVTSMPAFAWRACRRAVSLRQPAHNGDNTAS